MRIQMLRHTPEDHKGLHGRTAEAQKIPFYLLEFLEQEDISLVDLDLSRKSGIQIHAFFPLGKDKIQRLSPSKQESLK